MRPIQILVIQFLTLTLSSAQVTPSFGRFRPRQPILRRPPPPQEETSLFDSNGAPRVPRPQIVGLKSRRKLPNQPVFASNEINILPTEGELESESKIINDPPSSNPFRPQIRPQRRPRPNLPLQPDIQPEVAPLPNPTEQPEIPIQPPPPPRPIQPPPKIPIRAVRQPQNSLPPPSNAVNQPPTLTQGKVIYLDSIL